MNFKQLLHLFIYSFYESTQKFYTKKRTFPFTFKKINKTGNKNPHSRGKIMKMNLNKN